MAVGLSSRNREKTTGGELGTEYFGEARSEGVGEKLHLGSDEAVGAAVGGVVGAAAVEAVGGSKTMEMVGAIAGAITGAVVGNIVAETRRSWGVTQRTLARMVGHSERSIIAWEKSGLPYQTGRERQFIEMQRLHKALSRVLPEKEIRAWLERPNEELDGSTPLQVIERGQIDRIYEMIFYAESGIPD